VKILFQLFGIGWGILFLITLWNGENDLQLIILAMLNGIWAEVL